VEEELSIYESRECLLDESSEPLFDIVSKLGRRVRISKQYWDYISKVKRPSVHGLEEQARNSLIQPIEVRKSKSDPFVYLYYGRLKSDEDPRICTVV
jgi:hypothetical protein